MHTTSVWTGIDTDPEDFTSCLLHVALPVRQVMVATWDNNNSACVRLYFIIRQIDITRCIPTSYIVDGNRIFISRKYSKNRILQRFNCGNVLRYSYGKISLSTHRCVSSLLGCFSTILCEFPFLSYVCHCLILCSLLSFLIWILPLFYHYRMGPDKDGLVGIHFHWININNIIKENVHRIRWNAPLLSISENTPFTNFLFTILQYTSLNMLKSENA